jgi:hypothetical protein
MLPSPTPAIIDRREILLLNFLLNSDTEDADGPAVISFLSDAEMELFPAVSDCLDLVAAALLPP